MVLDLGQFATRIYHTVVLGDPGGGKSTLAYYLAHMIGSARFAQDVFATKTPVIVVLREMRMTDQGPESILDYLQVYCESVHSLRPPTGSLEYALLNGRLFLIFDGLDELLDPAKRAKVVTAIEGIVNLYPNTPVLVTSRRINYDAAPLDPQMFEAYSLNDFDDNRIEDYVHKWFYLRLDDRSHEEREATARAFLRESREYAAEIRSNPLVLSLLCRLYRGVSYIPQNIPALYEACAKMLFITWDKRRHIESDLPFSEDSIERLMAYLAHRMFESNEAAVPEDSVIDRAREYIRGWLIDDSREADVTARAFVKYLKNRLWVFTEVGLTGEGVSGMYAFTHRTFLEYYAGMYIATNAPSSEALAAELLPHLESKQWDVVAQVAVFLRTKADVHAADLMVSEFLAANSRKASFDLLSFSARLLGFVVPRPQTLTQLVRAILDYLLGTPESHTTLKWMLLVSLARARSENRFGVGRALEGYARDILTGQADKATFLIGMLLQLPKILDSNLAGDASYSADVVNFWAPRILEIEDLAKDRINGWAVTNRELAVDAWRAGALPLLDVIQMHGARILSDPLFPSRRIEGEPGASIFIDWLDNIRGGASPELVSELEDWHDVVIGLKSPWFDPNQIHEARWSGTMLYDLHSSKKAFSSIVLLLAAFYEAGDGPHLQAASLGDLDGFKDVMKLRGNAASSQISRKLSHFDELVTNNCLALLEKWLTKQVYFCFADQKRLIP